MIKDADAYISLSSSMTQDQRSVPYFHITQMADAPVIVIGHHFLLHGGNTT